MKEMSRLHQNSIIIKHTFISESASFRNAHSIPKINNGNICNPYQQQALCKQYGSKETFPKPSCFYDI